MSAPPTETGTPSITILVADDAIEDRRMIAKALGQSGEPCDVRYAYESGASSLIAKPPSFLRMCEVMRALGRYWLRTVALPGEALG